MSNNKILEMLNQLNESINSITDEDLKSLLKNVTQYSEYAFIEKNILGSTDGEEADIHSREFLRQT